MSFQPSLSQLHIALVCGGPSLERGISLNSARSLLDHLSCDALKISVFYVNQCREWYAISPFQLYSNTPADFDFKVSDVGNKLSQEDLIRALKSLDLVFPAIHGAFGEDGELQSFLEVHNVPFVGPSSTMCKNMFHKHRAATFLKDHGYDTLSSCLLEKGDPTNLEKIQTFFLEHSLTRAVVKPVAGGSSIGVSSVSTPEEALTHLEKIFDHPFTTQALLEPFCHGREFTVVVLQNPKNKPIALIPNEIQISYEDGQLFDYRRKYLPTNNTKWLCPPSFKDETIETIRQHAEDLFSLFKLQDFVRIDGWVLDDGRLLFTDFNPISGMEQNSFLFLQAGYIGMTHQEVLLYIIHNACQRYGIPFSQTFSKKELFKKSVWVLFGGKTAERQVSLMSGTNVWLKLLKSHRYAPDPFFLDSKGHIWHLPYVYCLHHSVEEIYENCLTAPSTMQRLDPYISRIRGELQFSPQNPNFFSLPQKWSFDKFLKEAHLQGAFVFLALHGGAGEDGTYQEMLSDSGIFYNGSGPEASELCMNKFFTGQAIEKIGNPLIQALPKHILKLHSFKNFTRSSYEAYWENLQATLGAPPYIIKPINDGCSAGIVLLGTSEELEDYIRIITQEASFIPKGTFQGQTSIVELNPGASQSDYILEPFVVTDTLCIRGHEIVHTPHEGWLEFTVGVLENTGQYHAMNPSITIAESHVLSVEEKFQGGTGVNITPPPSTLLSADLLETLKHAIEKVAAALGIENYARIDCFFNRESGKMILIEANSLPALTPSTVFYQQGLAEPVPLPPKELLEHIIDARLQNIPKNPG